MSASGRGLLLRNVRLALDDSGGNLFDVRICDGKVVKVSEASSSGLDEQSIETLDADGSLLLPSLCHAHIHLDKCYLLDRCTLVEGDFKEALQVTAAAKSEFSQNEDDLYARGRRLILSSVAAGVTSMRAHVEVDTTVQTSCLKVGQRLKADMKNLCDVHLSGESRHHPRARAQLTPAAQCSPKTPSSPTPPEPGIASIGSAPYVEPTRAHAEANIRLILDLAHAHALHADFHLDYTLDAAAPPLVWFLLAELAARMRAGAWDPARRVA
ncbi:hypothetical protein PHLGIDRAFT_117554, partial [Phlebiopsis gigantea 11061_1 CR5-6]